jgi:hypothetical protein
MKYFAFYILNTRHFIHIDKNYRHLKEKPSELF